MVVVAQVWGDLMTPEILLYVFYVPAAIVLLRGTLLILSPSPPYDPELEVWGKCVALVAAALVVGLLPLPPPFALILSKAVTLVGMQLLFYNSIGMAFLAFIGYSVLKSLALQGIGLGVGHFLL